MIQENEILRQNLINDQILGKDPNIIRQLTDFFEERHVKKENMGKGHQDVIFILQNDEDEFFMKSNKLNDLFSKGMFLENFNNVYCVLLVYYERIVMFYKRSQHQSIVSADLDFYKFIQESDEHNAQESINNVQLEEFIRAFQEINYSSLSQIIQANSKISLLYYIDVLTNKYSSFDTKMQIQLKTIKLFQSEQLLQQIDPSSKSSLSNIASIHKLNCLKTLSKNQNQDITTSINQFIKKCITKSDRRSLLNDFYYIVLMYLCGDIGNDDVVRISESLDIFLEEELRCLNIQYFMSFDLTSIIHCDVQTEKQETEFNEISFDNSEHECHVSHSSLNVFKKLDLDPLAYINKPIELRTSHIDSFSIENYIKNLFLALTTLSDLNILINTISELFPDDITLNYQDKNKLISEFLLSIKKEISMLCFYCENLISSKKSTPKINIKLNEQTYKFEVDLTDPISFLQQFSEEFHKYTQQNYFYKFYSDNNQVKKYSKELVIRSKNFGFAQNENKSVSAYKEFYEEIQIQIKEFNNFIFDLKNEELFLLKSNIIQTQKLMEELSEQQLDECFEFEYIQNDISFYRELKPILLNLKICSKNYESKKLKFVDDLYYFHRMFLKNNQNFDASNYFL